MQVLAELETPGPGAGDDDRQIVVLMRGAIAQARSVGEYRVVQQGRTVCLWDAVQPLQEIRELGHVEAVDL